MKEKDWQNYPFFAEPAKDPPWWKQLIIFGIILGILFGFIYLWLDYQSLKDFKSAIENCELDCGGNAWQDYLEIVRKAAEESRKEGWPLAETEAEEAIWAYKVCMKKCVEKEMEFLM